MIHDIVKNDENQTWWETYEPLIAAIMAFVFYGGLILWIEIQESGGFAGLFHDKDKMLAKILMSLARLVR